jgi:putative membrane protein
MHDGWGFGMGWGWILGLVVIGAVVWAAMRAGARGGAQPPPRERTPEEVLRERFARGEIDEEEYRARRKTLREG